MTGFGRAVSQTYFPVRKRKAAVVEESLPHQLSEGRL